MKNFKHLSSMTGRQTLITGATGKIGRIMSETLAELGSNLILVDYPGSDMTSFGSHLTKNWKVDVCQIECDLESEKDRINLIKKVKKYGRGLNCLINNAAFGGDTDLKGWISPLKDQTLDTWRRAIEVNLTAPFHLSQEFSSELQSAKGGNIINIASIYAHLGPNWTLYDGTKMGNPAAYSASKGGLVQLTRWMATTLAPDIRVNSISPGGLFREQPEVFVKRYSEKTPLARMATEEDLIGAVGFLSSDLSQYVTGQNLTLDGGWSIW